MRQAADELGSGGLAGSLAGGLLAGSLVDGVGVDGVDGAADGASGEVASGGGGGGGVTPRDLGPRDGRNVTSHCLAPTQHEGATTDLELSLRDPSAAPRSSRPRPQA